MVCKASFLALRLAASLAALPSTRVEPALGVGKGCGSSCFLPETTTDDTGGGRDFRCRLVDDIDLPDIISTQQSNKIRVLSTFDEGQCLAAYLVISTPIQF